jgi:hypothetical protein
MRISVSHISEPVLQFGDYFDHQDPKTGLAEYGPFGINVPGLHLQEIRLGFIGTRESISGTKEWVERCSGYIESENLKVIKEKIRSNENSLFANPINLDDYEVKRLNKIQNRDFPGFNTETPFKCSFVSNPRWERIINHRELQEILDIQEKKDRISKLVELIDTHLHSITNSDPTPHVVIIALTNEIEEKADSVQISQNYYFNLRRAIKAKAMNQDTAIPIQILRRRTVEGKGDVQEPAIRAWNFCTAQYYKAGGVPWIAPTLEHDTCYVGVSFYVCEDSNDELQMRSSIAQAFDFRGEGVILRGDPFKWDMNLGRSPHLTRSGACKLMEDTLRDYLNTTGHTASRVVLHKTSTFWGNDRGEYDEISGLYEGIDSICPRCQIDFVSMAQTGVRLFREGRYPPLRGTVFMIEGKEQFLYTMGFVPYLETYPRAHVPQPWQLIQHIGDSSPKDLFKEILTLTKMNVNNCDFADGSPITISFSQKVGEIMKHIEEGARVQSSYRFYM